MTLIVLAETRLAPEGTFVAAAVGPGKKGRCWPKRALYMHLFKYIYIYIYIHVYIYMAPSH